MLTSTPITHDLEIAVGGRGGSYPTTRQIDSSNQRRFCPILWFLQASPLPGHFPPPTKAGHHYNPRSGRGDPDHLCTLQPQVRKLRTVGEKQAANTCQQLLTAGQTA